MPELPEVEIVRQSLDKKLNKKVLKKLLLEIKILGFHFQKILVLF